MNIALVLTTYIRSEDAATAEDAADRAFARLLYTEFLPSPQAGDLDRRAVFGSLDFGGEHALLSGVIHQPWMAPRISPWRLTSTSPRIGAEPDHYEELSRWAESGADFWMVTTRWDVPTLAGRAEDSLGRCFDSLRAATPQACSVSRVSVHPVLHVNASVPCIAQVTDASATAALLQGDFVQAPPVGPLRASLLDGLCKRYRTPDVFGLEQIARVNSALTQYRDQIFTTGDLNVILWNALPRDLTDALLIALRLPLDTPLRPDRPEQAHTFGCEVPGVLRPCFDGLLDVLVDTYTPSQGRAGSARFNADEHANHLRLAEGLAFEPSRFLDGVRDDWHSRGIDLDPPSAHRVGGLMP